MCAAKRKCMLQKQRIGSVGIFHINSTSLVDIELTPLRLKKAYDLQFPGPSVRGCLRSPHHPDLAVARGDTGFER